MRNIYVINFSGRTSNWEGWSKKFLAKIKKKGYNKLLTAKDEIPMVEEYEKAVTEGEKSTEDIMRCNNLNKEAFEDIILSIVHTTKQGKLAFSLVENCKTAKYPEGNCS